jgi:hypothetical protein
MTTTTTTTTTSVVVIKNNFDFGAEGKGKVEQEPDSLQEEEVVEGGGIEGGRGGGRGGRRVGVVAVIIVI